MSELIQKHDNRATIRWKLLTGASVLSLMVYAASPDTAFAGDSDRPQIWIELGGQLEGLNNPQSTFVPSFMPSITQTNLLPAMSVQRPLLYSTGEEGKFSFQPEDSKWVFSASVRYGRSGGGQQGHQQTPNAAVPVRITYANIVLLSNVVYPKNHVKFADGRASQSENHFVLDFQAGKDVGLGTFGSGSSSVLSAGVRIAQFTSKSNVRLHAEPDLQYPTVPISGNYFTAAPRLIAFYSAHIHFHDDAATESNERSFRGLGPSIAWNASVPVAGNSENGEITLDWGANAAFLFGRQKVRGHHQTTVKSYYYNFFHKTGGSGEVRGWFYNKALQSEGAAGHYTAHPTAQHANAANFDRIRSVTVPNFGGFAGMSYRYSDAKISIGYRADFFFGAMDGGIDTRQSENRAFYGPYASISIGLGN